MFLATALGVVLASGGGLRTVASAQGTASTTVPAAGGAAGGASVVVRVLVRGAPRSPGVGYEHELRCIIATGAAVVSPSGPSIRFALRAGETRTFDAADLPLLATADTCRVGTVEADGAETSYLTSQPPRSDGGRLPSAPGMVDGTGYRSSSARADGQTITVTHAYTGDLLVTQVAEGATGPTAARGGYAVNVDCDDAPRRAVRLRGGDTWLFTGVLVGSRCAVRQDGASFADTSDAPNDGIVIIVATPAGCFDLRLARPECRAAVTITNRIAGVVETTVVSSDSSPSTTVPDSTPDTTPAPATTAPVVDEAPAQEIVEEPTFTG